MAGLWTSTVRAAASGLPFVVAAVSGVAVGSTDLSSFGSGKGFSEDVTGPGAAAGRHWPLSQSSSHTLRRCPRWSPRIWPAASCGSTSRADAVARLTLNNPDKRNPLSHAVLDAIAEVLPRLDHGIDVRCVVITGAGRAFSAGYDIGAIPDDSFEQDAEALVAHPFHAAMEAVSAHPYPVLAAINGHCLGGGLELAVRCDLRLCAAEAKLGMPPAKLGLVYGHTGLERFIDAVGIPRTKELFLTGRDARRHPRRGDRPRPRGPPRRRDRGPIAGARRRWSPRTRRSR